MSILGVVITRKRERERGMAFPFFSKEDEEDSYMRIFHGVLSNVSYSVLCTPGLENWKTNCPLQARFHK